MLEEHQHPNPHKAREGKKKHRLVPDPMRAPIVLTAFEDYCLHGLGLGEICDKLNADLDRYPPPKRNRKDEMALRQTWSRSQLQAMLRAAGDAAQPQVHRLQRVGPPRQATRPPVSAPARAVGLEPGGGARADRRQGAL